MESPIKIGMTLAQVQAVARGEVKIERHSDYFDYSYASFEQDGWEHNVRFEDDQATDHTWATRTLESFQEGLELVEQLVTRLGAPTVVFAYDDRLENFEWEWAGMPVTTGTLSLQNDGTWHGRVDVHREKVGYSRPVLELAAAREIVAAIDGHLARVTAGEGARGAAVARWHAELAARRDGLEHFLDVVAIAAARTPIAEFGMPELLEQAGWLAQHAELFSHPDDWRDVLLLGGEHRSERHLKLKVHVAREGERSVSLVEGPFATGIFRVFGESDERYPIADALPLADVRVKVQAPTYRRDGMENRKPTLVTATFEDVTVVLSGHGEALERIARLLATLRARKLSSRP